MERRFPPASERDSRELTIPSAPGGEDPVVALLSKTLDRVPVSAACRRFAWQLVYASSPEDLCSFDSTRLAAILFDRECFGRESSVQTWIAAAAFLHCNFPGVPLIACLPGEDISQWPSLHEAGVFHYVLVPLEGEELLQSLGFVWAARSRPRLLHSATAA